MSGLIYGESLPFRRIIETIDSYADTEWPVLLLGETGVGKELIAERIHSKSSRRKGPFVTVNCAAIPQNLFESELFGHERGAFSGATQTHRGLFRQANGGTIFLDEIGELDLNLQAKILRTIELGEVRSVGGSRTDKVDVRVITATHRDLYQAVVDDRFRQDLFERLSVLNVTILPLRDRKEDIPKVASYIVSSLGGVLEPSLAHYLKGYEWPGNVRQLRNVLIRAIIKDSGVVKAETMEKILCEEQLRKGAVIRQRPNWSEGSLEQIEKYVIMERLKRFHGNRKRTAEALGIAKSTLHEKIRKWKLSEPDASEWPLVRDPSGITFDG